MWLGRTPLSILATLARASRSCAQPTKSPIQAAWSRAKHTDASGYNHFKQRGGFSLGAETNLYVLGTIGCCGLGFYIAGLESVPYTQRKHSLMISAARERELGRQIFEQVKADAADKGALLPDSHAIVERIRQVGMRIGAVADDGHGGGSVGHMKNLNWEFAVVDDRKNINAFVVPGGKVVIFTGLLLSVISSDNELAAVLAHEAAHVVARHSAEKVTELGVMAVLQEYDIGFEAQNWSDVLTQVAIHAIFGIGLPLGLGELAISLPHSRRNETEADVIGMHLMARACFNPAAAASVLKKLDRLEARDSSLAHDAMPNLLRTHPITSERVSRVMEELPGAKQVYSDSGCMTVLDEFTRRFS